MINHLRGKIITRQPTRLTVESAGIGFDLNVPLSTSRHLPDPPAEVTILVVMHITRDGVQLYGFLTEKERETFFLLTGVKGVGPRAALNLLSRFEPEEIMDAIARGRTDLLKSAPGIGPKKADAITRLLRTRLTGTEKTPGPGPTIEPSLLQDAISALVSLGLSQKEARERLANLTITPEMSLQDVLLTALRTTPAPGRQKP